MTLLQIKAKYAAYRPPITSAIQRERIHSHLHWRCVDVASAGEQAEDATVDKTIEKIPSAIATVIADDLNGSRPEPFRGNT